MTDKSDQDKIEADIEFVVQGHRCLIDKQDAHLVMLHRLRVIKSKSKPNLKYIVYEEDVDGLRIERRLHRVILNAPKGRNVDHINGNTLDNRRSNLRLVEHFMNMRNQSHKAGRPLPMHVEILRNKFIVRFEKRKDGKKEVLAQQSFELLSDAIIWRDKWVRDNDWYGLREHYDKNPGPHVMALVEACRKIIKIGSFTISYDPPLKFHEASLLHCQDVACEALAQFEKAVKGE